MGEQGVALSDYMKENEEREARVILRDISPPETPPCFDAGTELIDLSAESESDESVGLAFRGRPNVPAANVVRAIRRDIGARGYDLHISDSSYTGYAIGEVGRFVSYHDRTNFMTYIREVFDCDDFAQVLQGNVNRALKGVPFGTIWYYGRGWGHAVNIGYCHLQNRMYLVEPQNDRFYRFNKSAWRPGMIII
ncbi:MAG: hypothetical protein GY859_13860 [Desulfobacterales bacterium]|nr:hypothetical protein [Desulfobacterales bacterium]